MNTRCTLCDVRSQVYAFPLLLASLRRQAQVLEIAGPRRGDYAHPACLTKFSRRIHRLAKRKGIPL